MLEKGEYDGAIDKFSLLNGYKDSSTQIQRCIYEKANSYAQRGIYKQALKILENCEDFAESKELQIECMYNVAVDGYHKHDDYVDSLVYLYELKDLNYKDSAELYEKYASEIYDEAQNEYNAKDYKLAMRKYEALGDYKDSKSRLNQIQKQTEHMVL